MCSTTKQFKMHPSRTCCQAGREGKKAQPQACSWCSILSASIVLELNTLKLLSAIRTVSDCYLNYQPQPLCP